MVNEARKAELEVMAPLYLESLCERAGIIVRQTPIGPPSFSKAELIDKLLEAEGQAEPTEPSEPAEPTTEPVEPTE